MCWQLPNGSAGAMARPALRRPSTPEPHRRPNGLAASWRQMALCRASGLAMILPLPIFPALAARMRAPAWNALRDCFSAKALDYLMMRAAVPLAFLRPLPPRHLKRRIGGPPAGSASAGQGARSGCYAPACRSASGQGRRICCISTYGIAMRTCSAMAAAAPICRRRALIGGKACWPAGRGII